MTMTVSLIVAVSSNGVIGHDGGLPWHLPADLKHFKLTTMGHHLIIGRRTWDEVGKPLPGRTMIVVTRSRRFAPEGAKVVRSVEQALEIAAEDDEPFIGGGSQIYRIALARDLVHRIHLTRIHAERSKATPSSRNSISTTGDWFRRNTTRRTRRTNSTIASWSMSGEQVLRNPESRSARSNNQRVTENHGIAQR